jgi:hypothetical protein
MDAGTRLTADQLAALAPGDAVTIESGAELGRTRRTAGTVSRLTETKVFVRVQSPRGAVYVREFSLRTGVGACRGDYAALVDAPPSAATDERRREQQRIDALWRTWARNRSDVDALRELHAALGEQLHELQPTT